MGDLVDFTRDESGRRIHEPVDMSDVVDRCLERVVGAATTLSSTSPSSGWQVYGDGGGSGASGAQPARQRREVEPPGGRVGIRLTQIDALHAELVVSDFGPGYSAAWIAGWCSSGSTVRHQRARCPVRGWAWRSSNRLWSNTAARCGSRTPSQAGNHPERRLQARRFAEATGRLAKTDRVDATTLAKMGAVLELKGHKPRSEALLILRELITARRALMKDKVAAKTRLQTTTQTLLKNQINARLKQIDIQIRQVDVTIAQKVAQDEALSHKLGILISIPGIAEATAFSMLIEMPELGTLEGKQAASSRRPSSDLAAVG